MLKVARRIASSLDDEPTFGYTRAVSEVQPEARPDDLREGLKRVAVALKEVGRPFALTGG